MDKECSIEICTRPAKAYGYCNSHNERLRKTGSLSESISIKQRILHGKFCSVKGCGRKHESRGYCGAHLLRVKRWGDIREDIPLRDHLSVGYSVENCESVKKALGLCSKHYEKLKKYGDPLSGKEAEKGFVGKRFIDKYGYVFVYMPTEKKSKKCEYISEHRLAMAQKLGRKLLSRETVHHLNGNRQDNRPENLELWLYPQKTRTTG